MCNIYIFIYLKYIFIYVKKIWFWFPGFLMFQCNLNILVHVFDDTLILTTSALITSLFHSDWTYSRRQHEMYQEENSIKNLKLLPFFNCGFIPTDVMLLSNLYQFFFLTLKFSHLVQYFYCYITDVIVYVFFYNKIVINKDFICNWRKSKNVEKNITSNWASVSCSKCCVLSK